MVNLPLLRKKTSLLRSLTSKQQANKFEFEDDQEEEEKPVTYDYAIRSTFSSTCRFFQILIIIIYFLSILTTIPLINGFGFLVLEPTKYQCKDENNNWKSCTKEEICSKDLEWRWDESEEDHLDNWVLKDKLNLLCEPAWKIGFIASIYFIGVVATLIFVPQYADDNGRKYTVLASLFITTLALIGYLVAKHIYEIYFYAFLLGTTFAGKMIVGLSYVIEFNSQDSEEFIIFLVHITESLGIIGLTAWYQFYDRGWFKIQLILFFTALTAFLYFLFAVPESPKWYYAKEMYGSTKRKLNYISNFNCQSKDDGNRILKFMFSFKQKKFYGQKSFNRSKNYTKFLTLMIIMWTISTFSYYFLLFLTRYLEGSIFVNFYLEGAAGIIGASIAEIFYYFFYMRISFFITTSITLIFSIILLIYWMEWASPHWIQNVFAVSSGYPEDSYEDKQFSLRYLIPLIAFIIKVGVNGTIENTTQASFGENLIFPFKKRNTAIGLCQLIAKSVTIFSPLAAELPRPYTVYLLIVITLISLIASFFLPSYAEEEEFEKAQENYDVIKDEQVDQLNESKAQ